MKFLWTVGIDEAGRGPLAGPVAVGLVKLNTDFNKQWIKAIKHKDSKKLTPTERDHWFKKIKEWKQLGLLDFQVSLISNTVIDARGISYAIKTGMKACLRKAKINIKNTEILLDGSLKAPIEYIFQKTIIKGDEKIQAIGLASIVAKVTRDRHMEKLAKRYPLYGFDIHKGYGTLKHRQAIEKHGPSEVHRLSFMKNLNYERI